MSAQDAYIAELRAEVETLREENRQLREALLPAIAAPIEYGLTAAEDRLFRALSARESISFQGVRLVLGKDRYEVSDECARQHIRNLRWKLKRYGYQVEVIWGRGYRLGQPPADQLASTCVRDLRRTLRALHTASAEAAE